MESGAILLYLAGKTGRFYPKDLRGRVDVSQWLFWQMAGLGPMAGQTHHFLHYAPEKVAYAIDRYVRETGRLYGVLNKRLADREFIAGDYSIADMACYPWVLPDRQNQDMANFPHLARWKDAIAARPAVKRAYALVQKINPNPKPPTSEEERKILFGQDQTTVSARATGSGHSRESGTRVFLSPLRTGCHDDFAETVVASPSVLRTRATTVNPLAPPAATIAASPSAR